MTRILVQRSHDLRFAEALSDLDDAFDTIVASDRELGDVIDRNRQQIDGFVLFHLTDASVRAAELLLNERFNAPTTPIAYLGRVGKATRLPYAVSHFDQASRAAVGPFLSQPRRVPVLIVEDDAGIRDVLQLSLSRHYDVDAAADGAEALQRLQGGEYDIVVLDVMLPRVSGDEVFRQLRETAPDTAVLVITAHDTERRELDYLFGGADGYLAKPFASNRAFRQKLMETLRHHHERAGASAHPRRAEEAGDAWDTYERRMRVHV